MNTVTTEKSAHADNWTSIEGYEGLYIVSDIGVVHNVTLGCTVIGKQDNVGNVWVSQYNGKRTISYRLDRLVLTSFGNPPPHRYARVVHENRMLIDCRLVNLSWAVSEGGTPFPLAMHMLEREARNPSYWMQQEGVSTARQSRLSAAYGRMGGGR